MSDQYQDEKNKLFQNGKVWFIGAGPGDPELITLKGHKLIAQADLIIYAGSLVPYEIVAHAKKSAIIIDSAPLNLEETHALIREMAFKGGVTARVHTGDPSLYGAIREQINLLIKDNIDYAVIPGVTAAFAAAAAAKVSVTVPETVQSFSITRLAGRTPVPASQSVSELAKHGGTIAIYLSGADVKSLESELRKALLAEATPIVAAYRVGWPDEKIIWTNLTDLTSTIEKEGLTKQVLFLVLPGETNKESACSKLYDKNFTHACRIADN